MLSSILSLILSWSACAAAISVTSSTSSYVVNTEGDDGFIVTISRTTCDITSLVYRGTNYQYSSTGSHIASGLGSGTTVSYSTSGKPSKAETLQRSSADRVP